MTPKRLVEKFLHLLATPVDEFARRPRIWTKCSTAPIQPTCRWKADKTAKQLALVIPREFLLSADEAIERDGRT
jgi:hypothetical protein